MFENKTPWLRWVVEFFVIVTSVFLAVYLESASEERSNRANARVDLAQMLLELHQDVTDFERIITAQNEASQTYLDLVRWLETPEMIQIDSVNVALTSFGDGVSTLFPRRSSWTTMVSGGQLADLGAPNLVLELGQLFETAYARIDYVGKLYDRAHDDLIINTDVIRWATLDTAPLTNDVEEIEELRMKIAWLRISWVHWYRDLLIEYEQQVKDAISSLEAFLKE